MTGGRKRLAEENKVISASYEQWFVVCAVTQFDEMIRKIRWWKDTAVLKHEEVLKPLSKPLSLRTVKRSGKKGEHEELFATDANCVPEVSSGIALSYLVEGAPAMMVVACSARSVSEKPPAAAKWTEHRPVGPLALTSALRTSTSSLAVLV